MFGKEILLAFGALALSSTALADRYTVTVEGAFASFSIASNDPNTSLFGLAPGTKLPGLAATLVFTIDDTQGTQTSSPPFSSAIVSKTKAPTRLVIARVLLNLPQAQGFEVGGSYPPTNHTPNVERTLQLMGGGSLARSAIRVWTSEKDTSTRSTANGTVVFDCSSPYNAPFTRDFAWNAPFEYKVPTPAAALTCYAQVSYYRNPTGRIWTMALGKFVASSVVMAKLQ